MVRTFEFKELTEPEFRSIINDLSQPNIDRLNSVINLSNSMLSPSVAGTLPSGVFASLLKLKVEATAARNSLLRTDGFLINRLKAK